MVESDNIIKINPASLYFDGEDWEVVYNDGFCLLVKITDMYDRLDIIHYCPLTDQQCSVASDIEIPTLIRDYFESGMDEMEIYEEFEDNPIYMQFRTLFKNWLYSNGKLILDSWKNAQNN